jgi:hypothetical protein
MLHDQIPMCDFIFLFSFEKVKYSNAIHIGIKQMFLGGMKYEHILNSAQCINVR